MRTTKRVLNPERLRQVPEHFSWIDHRLVREHFIEKADVGAWALYLFLVTVADAEPHHRHRHCGAYKVQRQLFRQSLSCIGL